MAKHLDTGQLEELARKHLWVYFAQLSSSAEVPVIVRGEGCYIVSPEGDTDCLRGGAGESGAACVEQNDCAAGYHCGGVTDLTCARICEIGATSGEGACPPTEGNCQAYPYSPDGSGVCTRDTTSTFR